MNTRFALALLWLFALISALAIIEAYFWLPDAQGYPRLLAADRPDIYPPIVAIYSAIIAPLLAAIFFRPFRPPASGPRGKALTWLAIALTCLYNGLLLYLLAQSFWNSGVSINDTVGQVKQAAMLLGFLVVPVNAYYFGIKGGGGRGALEE